MAPEAALGPGGGASLGPPVGRRGQRPRATPVSLLMGCTHHVAVRLYVAVWPPMASMVQLLADCDIYMVMSLHCCGLCDALVLVRVCRLSVRVYDSQRGCRARAFI